MWTTSCSQRHVSAPELSVKCAVLTSSGGCGKRGGTKVLSGKRHYFSRPWERPCAMTITGPRLRFRRRGPNDSNSQELAFSVLDRKSTRLNSSHLGISYAVFCLKK